MSKLIIYVSGSFAVNGHKIREFRWSEQHRKFIWEGREVGDVEFNAAFEKAWRTNADLTPRAMVVQFGTPAVAAPVVLPVVPPAPVATITAREITADEAEAVLARLRPNRLKLKTGPKGPHSAHSKPAPKPKMMEVA